MKNWTILFNLLPLITTLVRLAEGLFGNNTGATKKEFVKEGIKTVADGLEMVSTGGQKDTWNAINNNFGLFTGLIDAIAGAIYPSDRPTDDTPDDDPQAH